MANERGAKDRNGTFIGHLHAFRGIAIMLIVFVHCGAIGVFRLGQGSFLDYLGLVSVFEALAHNATIFFALISGLLYAVLLSGRGWLSFFRGKALNVLLPYVLMTLLFTPFVMPFLTGGVTLFSGTPVDFVQTFLVNIALGRAQFTYWYIPVLAGLFALTPIVVWILEQRWGRWALIAQLAVPLVFARTFPDNSVQNVFVFLAPYAFGIWLGSDYEVRLATLRRYTVPLALVSALATIPASWLFIEFAGPALVTGEPPDWPINWYESVSYVQKMTLACLVLLVLHRHEGWLPRWLDLVATHAFAIYFLHAAVIKLLLECGDGLGIRVGAVWMNAAMVLILWLLALSISLALSVGISRLLGRKSRLFIGS